MTWSPVQVQEKMELLTERIEDNVAALKADAYRAGEWKAMREIEFSKALLMARRELEKSSEAERKAWAQGEVSQVLVGFNGEQVDLITATEIAERLYESRRSALNLLKEEAGMLRTLLVQARGVQDPYPR